MTDIASPGSPSTLGSALPTTGSADSIYGCSCSASPTGAAASQDLRIPRLRGIAWLTLALALWLSAGCARTRAERAFCEADPDGFAAFSTAAHALQERAPAEFEAYWRNLVVVLAQGVDYYGLDDFEAELEAAAPEEYQALVEVVNSFANEYEFLNWIAAHQGLLNSLRPRGPTAGTIRDPGLVSYPRFAESRRGRALGDPGNSGRVSDAHSDEDVWADVEAVPDGSGGVTIRQRQIDRDTSRAAVSGSNRVEQADRSGPDPEAIREARTLRDAKVTAAEAAREVRIAEAEAARDARLAELDAAEQTERREMKRRRNEEVSAAETLWQTEKERKMLDARAAMDAAVAAAIEAFWEDPDLARLAKSGFELWYGEVVPFTSRENVAGPILHMFHAFAEKTVRGAMEWGIAGEDWRPGTVAWRPLREEQIPGFGTAWADEARAAVLAAHGDAWTEYFAAEARFESARQEANLRAAIALRAATANAAAARDEALATANRQVSAAWAEYEAAREAAEAELEAASQRAE